MFIFSPILATNAVSFFSSNCSLYVSIVVYLLFRCREISATCLLNLRNLHLCYEAHSHSSFQLIHRKPFSTRASDNTFSRNTAPFFSASLAWTRFTYIVDHSSISPFALTNAFTFHHTCASTVTEVLLPMML